MKSILVASEKVARVYPFLGVAKDGEVVLFSKQSVGVTIHSPARECHKIGHYSTDWCMDSFSAVEGKITLHN